MACRFGVIAALAAMVLTPLLSTPAGATFAGTNGKIAFYREGDVWVMNPNGTGATKLTTNYNAEDNPAISPDGSRIAYEFLRAIWIMNADGSGQRALTDGDPEDGDPAWSPDDTRLVFYRSGDLWVMNADGSGQVNLTKTPTIEEEDPAWSPLGGAIAYTRIGCATGDGAHCVYRMNADGSGQTNLTPEDLLPQCPNQPGYGHYGRS